MWTQLTNIAFNQAAFLRLQRIDVLQRGVGQGFREVGAATATNRQVLAYLSFPTGLSSVIRSLQSRTT
jgi:hypothetical protein